VYRANSSGGLQPGECTYQPTCSTHPAYKQPWHGTVQVSVYSVQHAKRVKTIQLGNSKENAPIDIAFRYGLHFLASHAPVLTCNNQRGTDAQRAPTVHAVPAQSCWSCRRGPPTGRCRHGGGTAARWVTVAPWGHRYPLAKLTRAHTGSMRGWHSCWGVSTLGHNADTGLSPPRIHSHPLPCLQEPAMHHLGGGLAPQLLAASAPWSAPAQCTQALNGIA
jgi:hypothetical protein